MSVSLFKFEVFSMIYDPFTPISRFAIKSLDNFNDFLLTLRYFMESYIGHKGSTNRNSILQQGGILTGAEELFVANARPERFEEK